MQNFFRVFEILRKWEERFRIICKKKKKNYSKSLKKEKGSEYSSKARTHFLLRGPAGREGTRSAPGAGEGLSPEQGSDDNDFRFISVH